MVFLESIWPTVRVVILGWLVALEAAAPSDSDGLSWPRFRGNNGDGIGELENPPTKWTASDFAWRVDLPETGHSSPILWGTRLFVTSADGKSGDRLVICLNAGDGATLWKHAFEGTTYHVHARNSFATSTPAVDAKYLYGCWADAQGVMVAALDHGGKLAWKTDLGPYQSQHGFGASPIVYEDLVIVGDEQDGGGSLVALGTEDGRIRWRAARHGKNATYSTPCLFRLPGQPVQVIFTNWQHGMTSLNPRSGAVNWEAPVFEVHKNERAIASPIVAGKLVLGTCGFVTAQKHLVAVRPDATDRTSGATEAWRMERAVAYLPTPLYYQGRVYCCSEQAHWGVRAKLNDH